MSADPIITFADMRRIYCAEGSRQRFDWSQTNINLREFAQHGVPASQLRGYGYDALIDRVIETKRRAEAMGVTVPAPVTDQET